MCVTVCVAPRCLIIQLPLKRAHGQKLKHAVRGMLVLDFTVKEASIFLERFSERS